MMDICRLASDDQPDSIKMVEIDFQALCRICGALGENLTSVFGKRAADRLRERIGKYLQIDILAEDCLPTKVCDGCRETLDRFHELYEKCHRTDEKFRTMMNSAEELKDAVAVVAEEEEADEEEEEEEEEKETKLVTEEEVLEKEVEVEVEEEAPVCKKAKESKRDLKQEEAQGDSPEKHGELLRHSIQVVSFQRLNHEDDLCGEYQFLDEQSEEDEVELPQSSALGRAQTVPLSREIVEQGKVLVDGKATYKCAECGKKMASPYTYQAHLRIHSGERPFQCPHCSQSFRISQGLARHVREVHEKVRNYSCDICGKCFGNGRNLKEHRFLHTNEKPYSCAICGNSYNQKASLHIHKRTHETNRSYKCSVCSRSFYTRSKLQLHQTTHSDERAYACDECGQSFRSSHNLARHRKCHASDVAFQCTVCEAIFKQKRYLMKHHKRQHQQEQRDGN
ncbi:zinc finger and SCAN domain-containing protein 2-like isoform X2 [Ochlerotatus camptorhynchus]|uniref:zinc finger and SCAN domain-containing protein 2-like isoform X2 n=1 Tax=Ochlerotatus camptorhynchus TaxID=644619 RepID=UPI0031D8606B